MELRDYQKNYVRMENKEIWKDIKGYEGLYQVSSQGRVKSLSRIDESGHRRRERIMTQSNCIGYKVVSLSKGSVKKSKRVHRLIALTFIPNPENKRQVNHKNGIKSDNRAENLEWATQCENMQHSYDIGLRKGPLCGYLGSKHPKSKRTIQTDKHGNVIEIFGSANEASRITGIPNQNISEAAVGKRKSAGGYFWKYLND